MPNTKASSKVAAKTNVRRIAKFTVAKQDKWCGVFGVGCAAQVCDSVRTKNLMTKTEVLRAFKGQGDRELLDKATASTFTALEGTPCSIDVCFATAVTPTQVSGEVRFTFHR